MTLNCKFPQEFEKYPTTIQEIDDVTHALQARADCRFHTEEKVKIFNFFHLLVKYFFSWFSSLFSSIKVWMVHFLTFLKLNFVGLKKKLFSVYNHIYDIVFYWFYVCGSFILDSDSFHCKFTLEILFFFCMFCVFPSE